MRERGWAHLFLSSAGRLPRLPFVSGLAAVFALFAVFDTWVEGPVRTLTAWLVFLLLLFSACCLLAKRLHDRGRSGWWAAPLMYAFLVAWPEPPGLFGLVALAVLAVAAVDLVAGPGLRAPNRFGPPPAALRSAAPLA